MIVLIFTAFLSSSLFAQQIDSADEHRVALDECLKSNNITSAEFNRNLLATDRELVDTCLSRKGFSKRNRQPASTRIKNSRENDSL